MPAIYLTETDVKSLVNMHDAVDVVEKSFRDLDNKQAQNMSRQRLRTENVMMHVLAGSDAAQNQLGWKVYTTTRQGARFLVGIYDGHNGELLALIEANFLGQLRTGAASGVATKYLANPEASKLAVIGTGLQARTQAWAVDAVRKLETIYVYGRNEQRRAQFADQLKEDLSCDVIAVDNANDAIRKSNVVVTATTSKTPVFSGSKIQPGTHINAIGGNFIRKTELDLETFRRTSLIVCDSIEQCKSEAGEFVAAIEQGLLDCNQITELQQVVAGNCTRETNEQITLFKSVGLGLQDVALGTLAWQRASKKGIGVPLPF
ncbi:MAG: ornithine cyclodeaminase family protein [Planctomycetaceae bacterium]|nr:ornithine cyclodeaminase family protein [Planctomycetaceae bacterium]